MIKRLYGYMKQYNKYLILSCLCVIGETVFELVIPLLMADIIDIGVANGDKQYIITQGIIMVICAFIALVLGVMYARYAATAGQGFGANIRKEEFEKVQKSWTVAGVILLSIAFIFGLFAVSKL